MPDTQHRDALDPTTPAPASEAGAGAGVLAAVFGPALDELRLFAWWVRIGREERQRVRDGKVRVNVWTPDAETGGRRLVRSWML